MQVIRCTLSGSFHKDPILLRRTYQELAQNGCQILSPHVVDFEHLDEVFVKHHTETTITAEFLETHHLLSIAQSNFLWVFCPDGYIGLSSSFEIGYAAAKNIPIFSNSKPTDTTLSLYVEVVPSVFAALEKIEKDT